ncbi:MAG: sulfite exporter TauE/SafE family protein [Rhodobacteraceae bacterium]|jgi:uncharacterized protein|nr:sulfite exporter TauE/SafE family protein [Paracoccaceae bacterium]
MDIQNIIIIATAFAFGGILKGATGAGAPLLAVPTLAIIYDVPFAVAMIVLPNIVPNIWQTWQYRRSLLPRKFVFSFAFGGALGAGLGTIGLSVLDKSLLSTSLGIFIISYVLFRVTRPSWVLDFKLAQRFALIVGTLAGCLQGVSGISGPISLTFFNSINLKRSDFIFIISIFFIAMGLTQLPVQIYLGIMTMERFGYSFLSLIPLVLFMPLGSFLTSHMSAKTFNKIILVLLLVLGLKLIIENIPV